MMIDIDVYGNTGELYVSVTSNLQIKQNRNLSKNWIFFDPPVLKIMSTYNVSFEKNVGILKHLQKKKRIFHLLKVSFEAPTRFYSNFFYGLWLAGKKKKKKKKNHSALPHKCREAAQGLPDKQNKKLTRAFKRSFTYFVDPSTIVTH